MINLLPPEHIRQLHASRQNTGLIRGLIFTFATLIVIILVIGSVYLLMESAKSHAQDVYTGNQSKAREYTTVEKNAKAFTTELKTTKDILTAKTSYTDMLINFTAALPPDAVIDTVSFNASTVGTPTTLQARVQSYDKALELAQSFRNSGIAKDVSIVSVSKSTSTSTQSGGGQTGGDSQHPFQVALNLTYTDKLKEKVR
jgi:Tfp pilus assembly protein PilN